jgi:hypothetical protein
MLLSIKIITLSLTQYLGKECIESASCTSPTFEKGKNLLRALPSLTRGINLDLSTIVIEASASKQ